MPQSLLLLTVAEPAEEQPGDIIRNLDLREEVE